MCEVSFYKITINLHTMLEKFTTHVYKCTPSSLFPWQQDQTGGYMCRCVTGYDGTDCENDINECAGDPCMNEGTCNVGQPQRKEEENPFLTLPPLLSSLLPPSPLTPSLLFPLSTLPFANSQDLIGMYTCDCDPAWTGVNCETEVDECEAAPCKNGGTCHVSS